MIATSVETYQLKISHLLRLFNIDTDVDFLAVADFDRTQTKRCIKHGVYTRVINKQRSASILYKQLTLVTHHYKNSLRSFL